MWLLKCEKLAHHKCVVPHNIQHFFVLYFNAICKNESIWKRHTEIDQRRITENPGLEASI